MVRFTVIARVIDGLPLAASQEDENDKDLARAKSKAKQLLKKLTDTSPARCSIDIHDNYMFHYQIEAGVCYLALCDASYPKKLAFTYLEELQKEFDKEYGAEVGTAARPYAFIQFDTFIQKMKKRYQDARGASSNLRKVNTELVAVQHIMMKNIEDVLGRGEQLDSVATKASALSSASKKYAKDAKMLSWNAMLRKWAPVGAVGLVVFLMLAWRFLL